MASTVIVGRRRRIIIGIRTFPPKASKRPISSSNEPAGASMRAWTRGEGPWRLLLARSVPEIASISSARCFRMICLYETSQGWVMANLPQHRAQLKHFSGLSWRAQVRIRG